MIQEGNLVVIKKEILAVCCHLYATNDLPDETSLDILNGLQKCVVPSFREIFAYYQTQVTIANLVVDGPRVWNHFTVMEEVVYIMHQAVVFYHNICTTGN